MAPRDAGRHLPNVLVYEHEGKTFKRVKWSCIRTWFSLTSLFTFDLQKCVHLCLSFNKRNQTAADTQTVVMVKQLLTAAPRPQCQAAFKALKSMQQKQNVYFFSLFSSVSKPATYITHNAIQNTNFNQFQKNQASNRWFKKLTDKSTVNWVVLLDAEQNDWLLSECRLHGTFGDTWSFLFVETFEP